MTLLLSYVFSLLLKDLISDFIFHKERLWDGRTKVCSNGLGHMTKMAAMPIYGKNLKKLLL